MTRFAIAAVLVAFIAARGDAQPVPVAPPGPGGGPAPAPAPVPAPAPIVIPVPVTKPPVGYYKSGGILVGADGYYPFDTGHYLLGGFNGLARYSGTYYVVPSAAAIGSMQPSPAIPAAVEPVPIYAPGASGHRGRLFHRR